MNIITSDNQQLIIEGDQNYNLGVSMPAISFVQLVFESDAIVVGRITKIGLAGQGNMPGFIDFEVSQSFRRSLPSRIHVIVFPVGLGQQPAFDEDKTCILFLTNVTESEAILMGPGDMGKWPRITANWLYTIGHVQPLDQVLRIIKALLEVESMNSYEERTVALTSSLFLKNSLGQIAAFQFAANNDYWPKEKLRGEIDLRVVRAILVSEVLLSKQKLDITAEVELMHQLLEDLPPSVAFPKWIEGLTHQNVGIRNTAIAVLKAIVEEDFKYDSHASQEHRTEAVERWQEWLDEHLPAYLKQDVPRLLNELRSNIMLRRQAANLLLCVISRQDVGFVADDVENKREVAVKRWEDWWKSTLSQL